MAVSTKKQSDPIHDIEDLYTKHLGVKLVKESAPNARHDLLKWYDQNHRVLPWRRNKHSKHCVPKENTDLQKFLTGDSSESRTFQTALSYWMDVETTGSPMDVPSDQYAYGVWVSEIMSQQTQIERVAVYWRKWMSKWPTAELLATATQEQVNEVWAGLGYYRRARFLLEGAKYVVNGGGNEEGNEGEKKKMFPSTVKALSNVPGVGPYTAAAVASIAFNEPVAAVDGNVIRVGTRLGLIKDGGDAVKNNTSASKAVKEIADSLLCHDRPGDFNQAMMELGATVCTPRNPKCDTCPVSKYCEGLKQETVESQNNSERNSEALPFKVTDLPEKDKKAEKRLETVATRVMEVHVFFAKPEEEFGNYKEPVVGGNVGYLVTKRPEGGLLGGLWEFPSVVMADEVKDDQTQRSKAVDSLIETLDPFEGEGEGFALNVKRKQVEQVGEVTHVFSHVKQLTNVERAVVEVLILKSDYDNPVEEFFAQSGGEGEGQIPWRWVMKSQVNDAGLTSGPMKVVGLLSKQSEGKKKKAPKETAIGKMFAKQEKRQKT